jgi:hypothetical protein
MLPGGCRIFKHQSLALLGTNDTVTSTLDIDVLAEQDFLTHFAWYLGHGKIMVCQSI